MKQSGVMQKQSRQSNPTTVRERAAFSYDPSASSPDLKEQILRLKAMENSPYWNRSFADIAGMILMRAVPKEIQRYEEKNKR